MSSPSTFTVPAVAVTIPQTMLIRVVLPAPFGPSKAKISPLSMSRSTARSASWPDAYLLPRPRIEMIVFIASSLRRHRRQRRHMRRLRRRFRAVLRVGDGEAVAHQHRNVGEGEEQGQEGDPPHLDAQPGVEAQPGAEDFVEDRHAGEEQGPVE